MIHELFNRKMKEFINDLIYIYPSVDDFKVLRVAFMAACVIDIKSPSSIFHSEVVQRYEDQVMAKDEDFFMKESYDHVTESIDVIPKLKSIWQYLSSENKESIWKYMHVLVVLSKQCK